MKHVFLWVVVSLLVGCSANSLDDSPYLLQDVWLLRKIDYPVGRTEHYNEAAGTMLRLYEGDSVAYLGWLTQTESGLIVKPLRRWNVTLINKGNGEFVYLEEDNPRPLSKVDDTTMVLQQNGALYTWHQSKTMARRWGTEIKELFSDSTHLEREDVKMSYMLSEKERRQSTFIHGLWALIAVIVTLAFSNTIANRRRRQQLQLQLQQIQESQLGRSPKVKEAIEAVETDFFASDGYRRLQRRIASGQLLKDDEWQVIEETISKVYPGFCSQLRGLYDMSELEYQVCIFVKLRIAPSDMAAVLARDVSTISTVRSRLYKKVFGRKGGAKDWDDFVLSMGV